MSYSSPHRHSSANVSDEIRLEIQRFESVHPSIYAIYDLIEGITDPNLQNQIRDHVVNIEDSFVNSQEWTTSRGVPDLKLGIAGFVNSGKSALVHRYLTGSYMQEESPEGGRFKKEIVVDGQSYLLLIRDEGGTPESQFTNWVDVVIFVFSLENEMSFNAVPNYYSKMCHYRDMSQIPIILVGTQDNISEDNPRKIDDSRAKQLELELGARCKYFETCATYGLNVEHVFQEACQRASHERVKSAYNIISRVGGSGTSLHRNHAGNSGYANPRMFQQSTQHNNNPPESPQTQHSIPVQQTHPTPTVMREHSSSSIHRTERQQRSSSSSNYSSNPQLWQQPVVPPNHLPVTNSSIPSQQYSPSHEYLSNMNSVRDELENPTSPEGLSSPSSLNAELNPLVKHKHKKLTSSSVRKSNSFHGILTDRKHTPNSTPVMSRKSKKNTSQSAVSGITTSQEGLTNMISSYGGGDTSDNPTPLSTPTQSRKHNRRRSNLFNNTQPRKEEVKYDELGVGREIPVKQGYLYKKGSKGITKDWKKKYVTLTQSGKLIYHPNINDYMQDSHGKEITLLQTTVKIPGQYRPRLKTQLSNGASTTDSPAQLQPKTSHSMPKDIQGLSSSRMTPALNGVDIASAVAGIQAAKMESTTPHIKRRHRRAKSGSKIEANGDGNDSDGYEFTIVSLDNKQWHFEATTQEDRDIWVNNIEKQILQSLTGNCNMRKSKHDPNVVNAIKNMPGNNVCADCGTNDPSWASLNLGSLICIECSGIHRNLGTHHSRVRSLELDEWPPDVTAVMLAIGNQRSNSIWEARAARSKKPTPTSSRDIKEQWIRSKYEHKEFLAERPHKSAPISHLLIDAIARQELSQVIVCLADSSPDEVSAPYSVTDRRTPLHIAAQQDNPIFLQLLLWYGADVKKLDQEGRSALWYAKQVGSKECSTILQANGSSESQATLQRMRKSSLKPSAHSNNNETARRDRISVNSVN